MYYSDYSELPCSNVDENVEDVRQRMRELAPHLLLNRFLAMDYNKMPNMQVTFAHLGPLIEKLTLRDNGPSRHKFNSRIGIEAGRLLMAYCRNGTIPNKKNLTVGFSRWNNERGKVMELAKYLTNLKILDCVNVRDKWFDYTVEHITQHCPRLERLSVVADYIDDEELNVNRIIPQHVTLKRLKILVQLYNHSSITSIMSDLSRTIMEKMPNLAKIEMEIEIDAFNADFDYEQEEEFLRQFDETNDMYRHFKEMDNLNRCVFSYSYLYDGSATLKVMLI